MSKKGVKYSYDPLSLIELIERRPCIWDKTIDDYKDRVKKTKAWTEVYQFLIEGYENLQEEEKVEAGKTINDKWKHIRDAFATSLKKKSGDERVKKYIYFDQLQFLLKILEKDNTTSSICDNIEIQQSDEEESSMSLHATDPSLVPSSSRTRKRSKTLESDETDKAILKALEATYQLPLTETDEDTAFFTSVTPAVKKFTEDQKLEFRMEVLRLIKQIKEKRYEREYRASSINSYHHPTSASYESSYSTPTSEYLSRNNMFEQL